MPDRDKVIKCIEACTGEQNDCAGHTCPYWDFDGEVGCRTQMELDALALLKEQDYRGWLMDMFHKYGRDDLIALLVLHGEEELLADVLKEQEVVRCKDCRRYPECCRPRTNDPNWFCADGERREDNGQADGDAD